ncbi:MAG: sulfur reduction protein DsrS [Chromatiales bacterium]|nr:sulfur reduction protein DsrS [Chromatiales bacterium]
MTLYGLLQDGEATVKLNPTGRDEKYLKSVRGFLSEKALGSPGGYPLYLQRWTRQGQMRQDSLEQLLLLGDPTAVFAVVCAGGLTDELGRRAWWAADEAENARCMLQTEAIVKGETGKVLAKYLVDHLAFETETETMVESVRMALQPGLLDEQLRNDLWKKAGRKTAYLLGFLAATPDDLPEQQAARADYAHLSDQLVPLVAQENRAAKLLLHLLSGKGQTFLMTAQKILAKPPTQDIVNTTLDVIRYYCAAIRPEDDSGLTIEELEAEAEHYISNDVEAVACLERLPELEKELQAMRILSGSSYGILRPVLAGSTALGSLMRKKLQPVMGPYQEQISILTRAC